MLHIREAIVVEGRYDRNALAQVTDALILETGGFRLFRDPEKLALLRRVAERRGLIVLTDSDGAGFVIRNRIRGAVPPEQVKHAYIPDRAGKERRKRRPGREGKIGVEGMSPRILEQALRRAGATFLEGEDPVRADRAGLTKADLCAAGLAGGPDSASLRRELLRQLDLPEYLSANALLQVLNACYSASEAGEILEDFAAQRG